MALVFVLKPLFYVVAFVLAHMRFKAYGPHSKLPPWLAVALASLARVALGVVGFFVLVELTPGGMGFLGAIFVVGFLWWLLLVKAFFRRAPPTQLLAFAVIAELMSAGIDYATMVDLQQFRLC